MKPIRLRTQVLVLGLSASALLAGCGSGEKGTDGGAPAADGSAAEAARDGRGRVRCPAKISTPTAPAGTPVVDVIGLRPGLTYDEAANLAMCDNPLIVVTEEKYRGFDIQTNGQAYRRGFTAAFAQPQATLSPEEQMQETLRRASARSAGAAREDDVVPGQSKIYVATLGLPGQERVISASRRQRFEEGGSPTMAAAVGALTAKYGAPTYDDAQERSRVLRWAYDPTGRRITETSPYYYTCSAPAHPDSGSNLSPNCGVVVQAELVAARSNPDLAEALSVGVIDQAGGYRLLNEVEQAFAGQDQARRAAEVERAAQQGAAPKL